MFVHSKYESINVNTISHVDWNFGVEDTNGWHTVVCIWLGQEDMTYLYYKDKADLKAIFKLKEILEYPYDFPPDLITVSKS